MFPAFGASAAADRLQAGQGGADVVGARQVGGGVAQRCEHVLLPVAGRRRRAGDLGGPTGEVGRPERRQRGRGRGDPRLDEVPVGLEVLHDAQQPAQDLEPLPVAELDEAGGGEAGPDLVVGVVEQAVEQVVPPLVEGELALQLVEHGEPRRQAGLDGELEQDPPGERVQRADGGAVELVEGGPPDAR